MEELHFHLVRNGQSREAPQSTRLVAETASFGFSRMISFLLGIELVSQQTGHTISNSTLFHPCSFFSWRSHFCFTLALAFLRVLNSRWYSRLREKDPGVSCSSACTDVTWWRSVRCLERRADLETRFFFFLALCGHHAFSHDFLGVLRDQKERASN